MVDTILGLNIHILVNQYMQFSIVIPCYPPDFVLLDDMIVMINSFHMTPDYSIKEIILAVSETTDVTLKVASLYPIIVHATEEPCNAARNRNRGWEKVTGDWIVFLDADDIYHTEKLMITYQAIQQFPDIDCVVHSFVHRNDSTDAFFDPVAPFTVVPNQSIYECMFPDTIWQDRNPDWGGYNITLPADYTFSVHHGMATVRASSSLRYDETLNWGEDGKFCSQHVFANKLIALDAVLMIYLPDW